MGISPPPLMGRDYLRTLLIVSSPGTISSALAAAIQGEFSWLAISHVNAFDSACAKFESDVDLILVDPHYLAEFDVYQARLAAAHPGAATAIIGDVGLDFAEQLMGLIERRNFRGVLPMNVNLDVLLSILRILLRGGDYIPHALFTQKKAQAEIGNSPNTKETTGGIHVNQSGHGGLPMTESFEGLTEREMDILSRVAKGNQNKIIASDLHLSENTVKIHIHNIIMKLGVHNRTEAAACYFKWSSEARNSAASSALGDRDESGG